MEKGLERGMIPLLLLLFVASPVGRYPFNDSRALWIIEHKHLADKAVHKSGISKSWGRVLLLQALYEGGGRKRSDNNHFGMLGCSFKSEQECFTRRIILQYTKPCYRDAHLYMITHKCNAANVRQYFLLLTKHYAPNAPEQYAKLMQEWYIRYKRYL